MSKNLTEKQRAVFNYIQQRIRDGYPPSIQEISTEFDIGDTVTLSYLNALQKKKYIHRKEGKARSISILKEADPKLEKSRWLQAQGLLETLTGLVRDAVEIPILGTAPAGTPTLAVENIMGTIPVPKRMVKNNDCFALRITGDSMIGIGIMDGDYVVVKKQPVAEIRDIVAARVENEATIKRYFIEDNTVRLQPENPEFEPLILNASDVVIIGIVIGLIREDMSPFTQR